MESDLAGTRDGIAERFVPDQDAGRLIEVEHLARYRWAAQLAAGKTVLDAGCGTAYGSRLLAEAGAREVIGIDSAQGVLDAVAGEMPETVSLQSGDLTLLELADDHFELVVCFEAIEHVANPAAVLDELVRVLAPGGLLLVSSPNAGVYPSGNPHHVHEFGSDELATALRSRCRNVTLYRQADYIVSALLTEAELATGEGDALPALTLSKLRAQAPGEEVYAVALAGDGELPGLPGLGAMTGTLELREWMSVFATQTDAITNQIAQIAELRERLAEPEQLERLLADAEQRLAKVPELELQITLLEEQLQKARGEAQDARSELAQLDKAWTYMRRALRYVRPYIGVLKKIRRRLRSR